jgi:hypothetical protein
MKLTWFGGRTLRVHIGGKIVVFGATGTPTGVDRTEVVSGADRLFEYENEPYWDADPLRWRPRRHSPLKETDESPVMVYYLDFGTLLVDAIGEAPLVLMGTLSSAGRWSSEAAVVAFSEGAAINAIEAMAPRLIALALPEGEADAVFNRLRDRLSDTALVALEPGMALEV